MIIKKVNLCRSFRLGALFVLCFFLFGLTHVVGQQITTPQEDPTWEMMMRDPNVSFFETRAKFNQHWANRPMEKGKGFKAFKRWEWFMEPRVNPQNGAYPQVDAVWEAMQDNGDAEKYRPS